MDSYVMRGEYEEHARRVDEEQRRQDKRIELVEDNLRQMQTLTLSVEKLAISMENMAKEQKKQGEQIEALEEVPKKNWDTLKYGILGALATALGGYIIAIFNYFI